ncbi:hypothetical protein K439DRAFT_632612 [Ramaria rubella]|nr:hypothetical protein K439DRAFT_632612 [Ramaria rubella]
MVDHRTRLSLDEQTSSATSLPPRSTSSLGGNFLETKQTVQDTQCNSVHKELTDPAAIAIVHAGASHHIDQFANRPTRNSASASTDLFPSSGQSTLISRSVDNLGWMESSRLNDHSGPNTLHLHPFAHTSASAALGSSLSSGLRKSSISAVSSPQFSDPSCFPSTGSFMDMGKNIKGTRSHSYQVQNAGNRRGHVGSDGIPLITYHARKRGSRFWRTLLPPFFSFLDATKPVATISASAASVRASAKLDIPSSQSCGELPPRPAPYFYPRRVDYESEEFSSEQIMPGSFCYNRGERSQMTPLPTIPKPKSFSISRKICNPQSLGSEGMEEDGISLDSNEIKSWKQRIELENPTKKFRPSLRQRFGSSLRQSVGFQQLRNACSELDVSQLARHQDECETLGPGITDDPFASHSPQLFPPLVTPISTASSISLCRQMHPSLPVPSCSSAPASDLDHPNLDVRRRSFMHMDPDCDDSSTSSFPSASDRCDPQSSPSIFYSGSGVSLSTCTQPSDQHLSQSTSVQKHLLNPNVTPSLTADTDSSSIAASSPSLSDPSEVKANNLKLDYDSDQMKLSLVPFPCLNAPDPRIFVPDVYEESAVEEGTSQDQIFVSSRSYVRSVIVESSCIGAGSISPSKKSSGVGEESVADTSDGSMDVPESLTDLTPLTAEWPLPPQHSLLNTGMARLDTEVRSFCCFLDYYQRSVMS